MFIFGSSDTVGQEQIFCSQKDFLYAPEPASNAMTAYKVSSILIIYNCLYIYICGPLSDDEISRYVHSALT